jgi:nitrogen fixation protein NifB
LIEAGVETLTVTVNAVNPDILERLCAGVWWHGNFLSGSAGAGRLIAAQREGIGRASDLGMAVKVNMVLAPGNNDRHVEEVARTVAEWGALYMNIIPLLPAGEFREAIPPSSEAVAAAREAAGRHLEVFSHCRRCRADACGVPGGIDYARELYREFRQAETFSHG